MEKEKKKIKKKRKNEPEVEFYVMDIRYTDTYNPEKVKPKNVEYYYTIDGDGKEKICVRKIHENTEEDE